MAAAVVDSKRPWHRHVLTILHIRSDFI